MSNEKELRELEKWGPEVRQSLNDAERLIEDAEEEGDDWDGDWRQLQGALDWAEFGLKKQSVAFGRVNQYLKSIKLEIKDLEREMKG